MKTPATLSLFLIATLAGPALAETPVKATPADACPLAGPLSDASKECTALRVAYRVEISDCIDQLKSEADTRAGQRTAISSHTSRARFLICDADIRQKMAVAIE